jgi:hypothetical protein
MSYYTQAVGESVNLQIRSSTFFKHPSLDNYY